MIVAGYLLHFKPLDSSFKNRIEVFNECFAILTNYTLLFFTNFVNNVDQRNQLAYAFIACLGISFLVHLIFLIASNIKSTKLSCKKCSNKRKHKKIMDEKKALQEQQTNDANRPQSFPFVVDEMGNKYTLHPDCKCTLGCTLSVTEQQTGKIQRPPLCNPKKKVTSTKVIRGNAGIVKGKREHK